MLWDKLYTSRKVCLNLFQTPSLVLNWLTRSCWNNAQYIREMSLNFVFLPHSYKVIEQKKLGIQISNVLVL